MNRRGETLSRLSALRLQADMERLQAALRIRDKSVRNSALREYYTQIPSTRYELALIALNTAASVTFAAWIAHSFLLRPLQTWFIPLALVGAFFIADVISAAFHKWWDSYANEAHPIWGTGARAFRIHHEFPNNLNETPFILILAPLAPIMTVFYVGFLLAVVLFHPGPLACFTFWVMMQIFSTGNEIHKQAHCPNPPAWVRTMQQCGFFLRRGVHLKHHRGARDLDYGIVNGWSNGPLRRLDLWNRLDLFLWNAFGLFPRNWMHVPESIPPGVLKELAADPSLIPEDLLIYSKQFPSATALELALRKPAVGRSVVEIPRYEPDHASML